jgi:molecular chaperone DnaJ
MGSVTTLYGVLGVDPKADPPTIRRAYRELARRHHPDFGGDTRQMISINDAWHVLSDPTRRASYNRQLRARILRPTSPDGHTVMDFGRYEGWSLGEIGNLDENYLQWLSRMPIGRPHQREIAQILADRAAELEARRPTPVARKGRWGRFSR